MIKVLKAGFYSTIQDRGRVGFAAIGVPVSGVMDSYAANIANSILDNSLDDAVLEIFYGSTELQFLSDTFICVSGGDFSPKINDKRIQMNFRIKISKNDVLSFGKVNFGVRTYMAIKEGFQTERVLGSRSFYQNITQQTIIKKDDLLPISTFKNDLKSSNTSVKVSQFHFDSQEIKCYKGPEFDMLTKLQKEQLINQVFTISNDNNRMGYRLNEVVENNLSSILTSAVLPGTVQLTPSGKLIVLMRDCQITGGYPRILQLSEHSINQLSQKTTNDEFQFVLEKL